MPRFATDDSVATFSTSIAGVAHGTVSLAVSSPEVPQLLIATARTVKTTPSPEQAGMTTPSKQ